jgi:hypothetical protein
MSKNRFSACGISLFTILLLFTGCATTPKHASIWECIPTLREVSNDYFYARINPICNPLGCKAFQLILRNKTDNTMKIDWNKTFYVSNGKKSGGFVYKGVIYKERNKPRQPETIFSNEQFSKILWPDKLVFFLYEWGHETMPEGEQGVYLSVIVDGKEINENLYYTLSLSEIKPEYSYKRCPTSSREVPAVEDWIGLSIENAPKGIRVVSVNRFSPAYSKIFIGDLIKEINSTPVRGKTDYFNIIQNLKGSRVLFQIQRGDKTFPVSVNSR